MKSNPTSQVTIPYRHSSGKNGTSKVSLQPAIYEALLEHFNDSEEKTREFIKELALQGRSLLVSDLSLYVQSKALLFLMPTDIQSKVKLNHKEDGRVAIRYKNTIAGKMTKLTTFKVLHDILNVVYDEGGSQDLHTKFAIEAHTLKQQHEAVAVDNGMKKRCDISHQVRERIISNLIVSLI